MKKFFQILLILSLLLIGVFASPQSAKGSLPNGDAEPTVPLDLPNKVFLPAVLGPQSTYLVSGQVTGPDDVPLAGATIYDGTGMIAVTDQNGLYQIALPEGPNALAPEKDGYIFTPSMVDINVSSNLIGQDFSASAVCAQGIVNGDFEASEWWTSPSSPVPAVYATDKFHSPIRSARTGILSSMANVYSYSSIRTQSISVPATATSVTLRMWLYPISGESTSSPVPTAPSLGEFGDTTTAYDAQYVLVLDEAGNLLETLLWIRSNSQMWTYHEFNLNKWAGHVVKLQIGTYNDGSEGATALYIDDVSLEMCSGILPPPPPPPDTCTNQFSNSGFEYSASWGIPVTSYPAGYSYDYAYAGLRSMRTGIPVYAPINKYSYSDAYQTVTIPSDATSAVLRMKILPRSQELPLSTDPEVADQEALMPPAGTVWGDAVLAYDTVYILVLNPYTEAIIETLWSRTNLNSAEWKSKEFDLLKYRGKSIRIQFGTYNDGLNGKTSMYVDEAYVDTCTGVLPPPPPPPPVCSERVSNNSFETNLSWYIPATAFSAGYSTALAHSGLRSMRTGIVNYYHNRYSYSDFGQVVSIPVGSTYANLAMWLYNSSSEPYSVLLAERPTAEEFGEEAMAGDVQYLLILDYWGNWIDTLLWQRVNEGYWKYVSFDLKKYAGSTIKLQWGTYNDGWGGVTSMFVDDVSLVACP